MECREGCRSYCITHENIDRTNQVNGYDDKRGQLVKETSPEMALVSCILKDAVKDLKANNAGKRREAEEFIYTEALDVFLEFWGLIGIETEYFRKLARQ